MGIDECANAGGPVDSATIDLEKVASFSNEVRVRTVDVIAAIIGANPPSPTSDEAKEIALFHVSRMQDYRLTITANLQTILDEINRL